MDHEPIRVHLEEYRAEMGRWRISHITRRLPDSRRTYRRVSAREPSPLWLALTDIY